jgi:hypothetical protein
VLHHLIIRGIEGRPIFADNEDRKNLLGRMISVVPETMTRCYAWAFLTHHAHLLVRTGKSPLSGVMARLVTGYAVSFNTRHHCHGPLFQNR